MVIHLRAPTFSGVSLFSSFSLSPDSTSFDMDPSPPTATRVHRSQSHPPFSVDSVGNLVDLTSGCQISPPPADPLQKAVNAADQPIEEEDDFSMDVYDGDSQHPQLESQDSHGSLDSQDSQESQHSAASLPGNQEVPCPQYVNMTSLFHDTNPLAVAKASRTASSIADAAQKVHDNFVSIGMERHDFPEVNDEGLDIEAPPYDVSGPFRITLPELISPRSEFNRTFAIYGTTLDFVLTVRKSERHPWYIPALDQFTDVVNEVQSRIIDRRFRFLDVLVETKSWCGVGVISLKATCPLRLQRWREQLLCIHRMEYSYNSFPKDALITKNTQVSILLRHGLRNFKLHQIP